MEEEGSISIIDKLKEDRGALAIAIVALLLIIFGVFAVLGGAAVVSLNPPTNLQGTVVGNDIKLTWDHSVDYPDPCVGYNAYLSTAAGELGVLQNAEVVADNTYTIPDVDPGTYYATVRCVDNNGNEDGNLNQIEIKVEIQPPSDLSVIINDGAEYTNEKNVNLTLSAKNAEECAYANEDMAWSAWEPYTVEKAWELTENTQDVCEEKTVYYKCRNSGVESSAVSDTIILDTLPPAVSFNVLSTQDNLVGLQIFAQDDCGSDVDCYVFAGDQQVASIPNVAGEVEKTVEVPYGTYFLSVACTDDAGNTGSAALEINVEQNVSENETNKTEISIKINNDAEETTSLDVTLNLYARINGEIPDECYYSSAEMGEVGPEEYTTSRTWTLDSTEPSHTRYYTVCYRCEKDGDETPQACDSIKFVVSGDHGGGGGGGDGGQPPKDLRAEIVGLRPYCIGSNCIFNQLVHDTEVTKWNEVYVNLSSTGATDCKVWNEPIPNVDAMNDSEDEVEWSASLTYGMFSWTLIPTIVVQGDDNPFQHITIVGDGNRTINYKCKNEKGEAGPVQDTIWYDGTKPDPVTNLDGEYRTVLGEGGLGLPVVNIKLTWTPAVDNSDDWEGYTHKGVHLYTICRSYTIGSGDLTSAETDLGCDDYAPEELECPEGGNFQALYCTHTDYELPSDLINNGGEMCYRVSAWDYVGWQSGESTVCVEVPASGAQDEVPTIDWVAIYEGGQPIGGGGDQVQTADITGIEADSVGVGTSSNAAPQLVLLAQPGYDPAYMELAAQSPPPVETGDTYTRTVNVRVRVMATNADECMLGNDNGAGAEWSGTWVDYDGSPTSYDWTLKDEEGHRTVFVKCKNEYGESTIATDGIIYDATPPEAVNTGWSASYVETLERNYILVKWTGVFDDSVSGVKDYTVKEYTRTTIEAGGGKGQPAYNWVETDNWTTNNTYLYDYDFEKGQTYKYTIIACDNAGNCNEGVTTGQVTPLDDPYNNPPTG